MTGLDADVVVVGGGIVGLASARAAARRGLDVVVVEKEEGLGRHQTGRNSGVIHSGVYYRPGSYKASLVAAGRRALLELCEAHGVPYRITGKVIVAVDPAEAARLEVLAERGRANEVPATAIGPEQLRELEPAVAGVAALHVPTAGVVDFGLVADAVARELAASRGTVHTSWPVTAIRVEPASVLVTGPGGRVRGRVVVNCGGLHSDRLAALAGAPLDGIRIMAFRGEYLDLRPARHHLVRSLVYPLPDPRFPFLGVHLTRSIDGSVHAGPNAVPALAREGYRWRDVDRRDLAEVLAARSTWRLGRRYWRTGGGEIIRSLARPAFVRAVRRLVPDITRADLVPGTSGVRAQAVGAGGALLDDFEIRRGPRQVHVLNAPSPAATASLAIGEVVADHVEATLTSR